MIPANPGNHNSVFPPFLANGFAQIGILVPNLEQAVEQYWHTLHIGPWQFYTYQKPLLKRMTLYGKSVEYSMRIALANFQSMRLELIQPLEGDSIYKDFIEQHGYGMHHIGIVVEDILVAIKQAQLLGLNVIMDGSGFGVDGDGDFAYLDSQDTFGVLFELIQRPARRHPPEKVFPDIE